MAEQRKVVTVLFADIVDSTALATHHDPEVVRSLMSGFFQRVAEVSKAYGGTVEKFAGDAAMVVFGVPAVHDDDAERAVRAALEIRAAAVQLETRIGVNTGEAVTEATEDRQFMVSGDAVNIAARLQQGAEAGEVLVGPLTHQLSRSAIEYESHDPVVAKGKGEALVAYRAIRASSPLPGHAHGIPGLHAKLVGRSRELRLLLDTFTRTAEERTPHLFTVLGAAGIGKSRLVNEALAALVGTGARVLRGRCLPYGRGITYWPLIEMLGEDTGIALSDEREAALRKLDRWLSELLKGEPQRPAVRARLAVMLGFESAESVMPDTPADRVDKEIGWSVRHYIEASAKMAPLIVVIDDLQWADQPVLAVVEQLADRVADVPLLIICIARPEFVESNAGWGLGKANSTVITLGPLNPEESDTLITRLLKIEALPPGLRQQMVERSAGNPLFCEEFINMLIDEGLLVRDAMSWRTTRTIDQIPTPEGIHSILAARLDLLPERERSVLGAASVIGEKFESKQVGALISHASIGSDLDSLRRKGLVAGDNGSRDEEYRFRHLLIRDAAYESLPKSERVALHDRFCALLEDEAGDPQQVAEILTHHAERAFTLSVELELEGELVVRRARKAVQWSIAMADRARNRGDRRNLEAAMGIARTASAALPNGGEVAERARLRLLGAQLMVITGDYAGASRAAAQAARIAEEAGLLSSVATARLTEAWVWHWTRDCPHEEFKKVVDRAIEASERADDIPAAIEARYLGSQISFATGRLKEYVETNERLIEEARSIGDAAHVALISMTLARVERIRGNVQAAMRHLAAADALATAHGYRDIALSVFFDRALWLSREGDLAAGEGYREYAALAAEAGAVQQQLLGLRYWAQFQLYLGQHEDAARALDSALEISQRTGERWNRSELLGLRAQAALDGGDVESADQFIRRALESLRIEDVCAVSEVHSHLGMIRAAQHREAEAEAALRQAMDVVADSEYHNIRIAAGLYLTQFLATRPARTREAVALLDEYVRYAHAGGWHTWDRWIADLQELVEVPRDRA